MKFIHYLAASALLFLVITSNCNAQASVKFLGGGTDALFQELGAASQSIPGINCIWTALPNSQIFAYDGRWFAPLAPIADYGSIFVAWGPGTGTCANPGGAFDVYSYMQMESVSAMRCYFGGCTQNFTLPAGTAGANLIKLITVTDTPIPQAVVTALQNQLFFVAGTDLRPEDAKFATDRMLKPLNSVMGPGGCGELLPRQVFNQDSYYTEGLGYNYLHSFRYEPHYGGSVVGTAALGGGSARVADFTLYGPDPATGLPAPSYKVSTIGAKPIIVAVAPNTDTIGIAGASDINGFTLALLYQGVLARASDLLGPTAANPVNVFVPDPLAGDYNVFEYSIPNGTQYHASQDYQNCFPQYGLALTDPLNLQSANGNVNASRQRLIGSDNMRNHLNLATTDTIGYFYWSPVNVAGLNNVKYLKVNGIDPVQDDYTNGTLPGSGGPGDPGLAAVTFSGLNAGNYPIWSVLRLVSLDPTPVGVSNMLFALDKANFQHDYVNAANLKVWHSHFALNVSSITGNVTPGANGATINPATPNDLCNPNAGATAEVGGDAGGSVLLKQANADFCADFNNQVGLINKTQ